MSKCIPAVQDEEVSWILRSRIYAGASKLALHHVLYLKLSEQFGRGPPPEFMGLVAASCLPFQRGNPVGGAEQPYSLA